MEEIELSSIVPSQEHPFLFWFVAIRFSNVNEYIKDLEKYLSPNPCYLIGKEIAPKVHTLTSGEHIHIACRMSVENYNKFHDNIHRKKMKLLLKASNGNGKQVGRIKTKIRDNTSIMSYTCKDKNLIYKNISLKQIQEYIDNSYPKGDSWETQLYDNIKFHFQPFIDGSPSSYYDYKGIIRIILNFYQQNSKQMAVPSPHLVKKMILRFLLYECRALFQLEEIIFNSLKI